MNATDMRYIQILQQAGLIDEMQIRAITARQKQFGGKTQDIVADLRFVPEDRLAGSLASGLNMPRLKLDEIPADPEAMQKLKASFCDEHKIFPCALRDDGKTLWIASADPLDLGLADQIRAIARVARVNTGVAGRQEIDRAIRRHYYGQRVDTQAEGGIDFDEAGDEQEFKITDVSGKTMVKHVAGVEQLRQAPAPTDDGSGFSNSQPMSGSFGLPSHDVFAAAANMPTEQEQALRKIGQNIERTNKVVRVIIELCIRKGVFGVDEYRNKVNGR